MEFYLSLTNLILIAISLCILCFPLMLAMRLMGAVGKSARKNYHRITRD